MAAAVAGVRDFSYSGPGAVSPVLSSCKAACPSLAMASSLVFHLEVEDTAAERVTKQQLQERLLPLQERLQCLMAPVNLVESRLMRDVRFYTKAGCVDEAKGCDVVVLSSKLATIGYKVHIRTAIGGGSGTQCFQNLFHEFLVVSSEENCEATELIVEPNFREQFRISHPTDLYSSLLKFVPEEFIGTTQKLVPVVQLLCSEMSRAFEQQGMTCPPWRQLKSVLSKWLPARSRDLDVAQPMSPTSSLEFGLLGDLQQSSRKMADSLDELRKKLNERQRSLLSTKLATDTGGGFALHS